MSAETVENAGLADPDRRVSASLEAHRGFICSDQFIKEDGLQVIAKCEHKTLWMYVEAPVKESYDVDGLD